MKIDYLKWIIINCRTDPYLCFNIRLLMLTETFLDYLILDC